MEGYHAQNHIVGKLRNVESSYAFDITIFVKIWIMQC